MKKLTILFLFIFSFINAQVSERINLPEFYDAQLARLKCTNTIEEIDRVFESVYVSLIEADEKTKLYEINWIGDDKIRTNLNLRIYFNDTYILINSFNYTTEIQKIVKGKKVYQKLELDAEKETSVNRITDDFVKSIFVKLIKTYIWE